LDEGAGGLLGGLGGLLDKLHKGGLGEVANSWVGSGQNQPVSPKQLAQRWVLTSSRPSRSDPAFRKKN
jgi:uncharacterized protein YidB (DUF937 family)